MAECFQALPSSPMISTFNMWFPFPLFAPNRLSVGEKAEPKNTARRCSVVIRPTERACLSCSESASFARVGHFPRSPSAAFPGFALRPQRTLRRGLKCKSARVSIAVSTIILVVVLTASEAVLSSQNDCTLVVVLRPETALEPSPNMAGRRKGPPRDTPRLSATGAPHAGAHVPDGGRAAQSPPGSTACQREVALISTKERSATQGCPFRT